jgi:hypothetical protein
MKARMLARFALALIGLTVCASPTRADGIVFGVPTDRPSPPVVDTQPTGLTVQTSIVAINFDDHPASCVFFLARPLRNTYEPLGVTFSGPDALSGGAILDECSNFSVRGYSAPNFLAFNPDAGMANGGLALGPERLTFSTPAISVGMMVGCALGGTATLNAYSQAAQLLGSAQLNLSSAMQLLRIDAPGIAYVELSIQQQGFLSGFGVVDDLSFDFGPVSTQAPTWGHLKGIYR